jgi:hypothetical protein
MVMDGLISSIYVLELLLPGFSLIPLALKEDDFA